MMTRRVGAIGILVLLMSSVPVHATRINANNVVVTHSPQGVYSIEQALLTAPLFNNAPFRASPKTVVPGFSDPLGTGLDPQLKLFSGEVHYMDVLGNYGAAAQPEALDIELPPGVFQGLDFNNELLSQILAGKKRAFDKSLFNLSTASVRHINGRPFTSEASPLSLAGFGSVSEFLKPIQRHWSQCEAQVKRARVWEDIPRTLRSKFKPNPRVCFSI